MASGLAVGLAPSSAFAETTRFIELEGFGRLLEGDPQSVSLAEDGVISLAPGTYAHKLPAHIALGAATVWRNELTAARLSNPPAIVSIGPKGQVRELMTLKSGVATRLFADGSDLLVASGPNAMLHKVSPQNQVTQIPAFEAGFIWDLARAPDGALLAVSGQPGAVWRLGRDNRWKLLWRSEEAHLKTILVDQKLGILVGGGERGIVYRAENGKDFRAIYDTQSREVTALTVAQGFILAAGVTGAQAGASEEGAPKAEVKSRLVRISLDGSADTLAGSTDEVIFDIQADNKGQVLVATGATGRAEARGRIYQVEPKERRVALLHQSPARRITQLLRGANHSVWALSQEGSHLLELLPMVAKNGTYISGVADLGVHSRLGLAQVLGDFPRGSDGAVSVRSGHTLEPDGSWSAWSPAVAQAEGHAISAPPGRFVQLKLLLSGRDDALPQVYRLKLAYLRHNIAPVVREVGAMEKGVAVYALPSGMGQDDGQSRIAPLFEKSDEAQSAEMVKRMPPRVRQVREPGALTIRWQAEDANGDELEYALWLKSSNHQDYKLVKDHLLEPFYTFLPGQLADGHYVFRVTAHDGRSNPWELKEEDSRVSRIILVDNTPPQITDAKLKRDGSFAWVTATIHDDVGPLTELTLSVDGNPPRPIGTLDGILDGPTEHIQQSVGPLAKGIHTLVIRAKDAANNEVVQSLVLKMPS